MLEVPGKICPHCGWDGGAGKDEAIVYLQCPECDTEWPDEEACARQMEQYEVSPEFRAKPGWCPDGCGEGELYFEFCLDRSVVVITCGECGTIWLDPEKIEIGSGVYPSEYNAFFVSEIQCSMRNTRWATRDEVIAQGWERHIQEISPYEGLDELIQIYVRGAIHRYDSEGRAAAAGYCRSPESVRGQWYVFIVGGDGYTIASPFPEMMGRDPALRVDSSGYFYGSELLSATEEGKWISYLFRNPLTDREARKHTWVVRHEGLFVAAGYYEVD